MADLEYYRTRYGLMPTLSGGRRSAGYGGGGDPSLLDLEEQANARGTSQRETMGEYAELLAPDLAAKEGISLDEARQRLTGGTRGPEGPISFLGRKIGSVFGAGGEPQGEEQGVRVSRLKGLIERRQLEAQDRAEANKLASQLYGMRAGVEDPGVLGEPTASALRRGGATDVPPQMRLKPPEASSLVGLYQRDPAAARELATIIYAGRADGTAGKEPAQVRLARMLAEARRTGNTALAQAIEDIGGKGANPRPTPEEVEFEKFVGSQDAQAQLAEEAAAGEEEAKKTGRRPPAGPFTSRYQYLFNRAQTARAGNTRAALYTRPEESDDGESADDFLDSVLHGAGAPVNEEPSLSGRAGRVR